MRNLILTSAMMLALAACGGSDKVTDAAAGAADAAGSAVSDVASAAADVVANDSAYVTACIESGGDRTACACVDDIFRAELDDDLYEFTLLSFQGNEEAATTKITEYLTNNPEGAASMGQVMQDAAEKSSIQCGG